MILNRKIQPQYTEIKDIHLHEPKLTKLSNNIPLAIFNLGSQDIIKLDLIFDAGIIRQNSPLIATSTVEMLQEGSAHFSGKEIAQEIDFLGGHLQYAINKDYAKISLYTLKKHFKKALEILADTIKNPIFPQKQLDTYISKQKQVFQLEIEKVKTLASRKFSETLFGKEHAYGKKSQLKDYDKIDKETLTHFFKKHYTANNCKIIIAGKIDDKEIQLLENQFAKNWNSYSKLDNLPPFNTPQIKKQKYLIEKSDTLQSSIRLGKVLFNRKHPDYQALQVVNTILGGYFGSRLMHNIREDKGYTYGIGSAIASLQQTGYFIIASEVNAQFSQATIKEVKKEIEILQKELVSEEELKKVKSYMLGQLIRSVDGPLLLSDTFLNVWLQDLDLSYYKRYIETIKKITSEDVRNLANKYLQTNSLIEIIAGK